MVAACDKKHCPIKSYCDAMNSLGAALKSAGDHCAARTVLPELSERSGITGALAQKAGGVLSLHAADAEELDMVRKISGAYHAEFDARMELWRRMIAVPKSGRLFTDVEYDYYVMRIESAKIKTAEMEQKEDPLRIIRARSIFDHFTLQEYGLLFDRQIIAVVDRLAGDLACGRAVLLTGEKGIAKTGAARFAAGLSAEPVFISGHGDMMSDVFTGKLEQNPETGMFRHRPGTFVEAAASGRPVLLDEVNISDQTIVMRLQDYLLKRPGDTIAVQESGHQSYTVKSGFVVFATANESSARYQNRNTLDTAFRDRFDVIKLEYPDVDSGADPVKTMPESLLRLALAHSVDEWGAVSGHIDLAELEIFVRLAYITEHLYSVPAASVNVNQLQVEYAASAFLDDQPVMTDCITPRSMSEIVKRCALGNSAMNIRDEIQRAIHALDGSTGNTANQDLAFRALALLEGKIIER